MLVQLLGNDPLGEASLCAGLCVKQTMFCVPSDSRAAYKPMTYPNSTPIVKLAKCQGELPLQAAHRDIRTRSWCLRFTAGDRALFNQRVVYIACKYHSYKRGFLHLSPLFYIQMKINIWTEVDMLMMTLQVHVGANVQWPFSI